jgi:hypothetical protein
MATEARPLQQPSLARLVLIPALISLVVTIVRAAGEVGHWSGRWFEPVTRGIVPSGVSWIIGISWLPIPFGVYFALKLVRGGLGPPSAGRAVGHALAGAAIVIMGLLFVVPAINAQFRLFRRSLLLYLVIIWAVMATAALLQRPGWPSLFKTLLAYGVAARVPVVVMMFLAMRGGWGTHYDYVDIPTFQGMPLLVRFLETAFLPQLIFWVGFTIVLGALAGSITAALARRR